MWSFTGFKYNRHDAANCSFSLYFENEKFDIHRSISEWYL